MIRARKNPAPWWVLAVTVSEPSAYPALVPVAQAPSRARIAVLSLHTSPLDQPGTGDSGGMNVDGRAAAGRPAGRGGCATGARRAGGVPLVPPLPPPGRVKTPAGAGSPEPHIRLADEVRTIRGA